MRRKTNGEEQDSDRRRGGGRRLCRRPYGAGRRRRHLHRSVAGKRRSHPQGRSADHPYPRRRTVHGQAARAASDRGAAALQGSADRHRLRLHEILRHGLGDDPDQAVSGARRLYRLAAELHERRNHRRHRRLGQDFGFDRQLDHCRTACAGPGAAGRRQIRLAPHRLPGRRGARPDHRPRQGSLPARRLLPTALW